MTYLEIINYIKRTALSQHNINWVAREFTDLNREDVKYSAIVIQDRDGERATISNQNYITYTWYLGYVDRLTEEKTGSTGNGGYHYENQINNRDDVISTGIEVINNIVNSLNENFFPQMEVSIVDRFYSFYQRFTAECGGVYVVLAVRVPVSECQDYDQNIMGVLVGNVTSNGVYHYNPDGGKIGWTSADFSVDVHPSSSLYGIFTDNGVYNLFGEWKDGEITVAVSSGLKPEEVLSETIVSNGSYSYNPTPGSVFSNAVIEVSVPSDIKPEEVLSESITSNGSYAYNPTPGSVFSSVALDVDVHPSDTLSRRYTTNGVKTITGEFNGGTVTVDVHPSTSLTRTFTSNDTYSISGEWKDAEITVAVSSQKPEETLIQSITANGSYAYNPTPGSVFSNAVIEVSVPSDIKPEEVLSETIVSNGSYSYSPTPGSVFSSVAISVDVHPSTSLSETYTSNGVYSIADEFNGGSVTVSVPVPVMSTLAETITSNGSYSYTTPSGQAYESVLFGVDVHPSVSYSGVFTSNGTTAISGEFNGGSVTVDVHPSTSLSETFTSNGVFNLSGEWKNGTVEVSVPVPVMSTLAETITSNGSYSYTAPSGQAYDTVAMSVDVHPSVSLSRYYIENGVYTIAGEFNGGQVTVSVPEVSLSGLSVSLSNNGSYSYTAPSGQAYDTVAVEVSVVNNTVTLTQSAYDALSVKDPDTIYLIYG